MRSCSDTRPHGCDLMDSARLREEKRFFPRGPLQTEAQGNGNARAEML
eukprot:CAMPEP_0115136214 /NCGR_PEP_ID=MMETSP0227-20121206/56237_1 /TAXON_ID=89957 /ORGANISM="Polarella glacialis, Strain CCMP 1383" /LENGTH=47 /DNA_ID= /DNA_START= /DNA_END= /DNA_ORIENTATION=